MATSLKNLSDYNPADMPSAGEMSFAIVVSDWNPEITHALYQGCLATLLAHGAKEDKIHTIQVPGSFELPYGARLAIGHHNPDAVICLGCVIKGETKHDEYISMAVAGGLTNLSMASNRPVIFGVLTPNNMEQARDRAGGQHGNKGVEAAFTAIRMCALRKQLGNQKQKIGF